MIYASAQDWENDPHKKVLLFGMSGLGKTHVSNMLRA
ncbi:MAG: ATPase, partial [Paracoccaceae bacterium]